MPMINKLFPKPLPQNLVNTILAKYPNDASLGCPFNTGDNTFGLSVAYKQAAAISSDATFISKRRFLLRQANSHGHTQTWSYEFEGPMPILPGFLGSES